MKTIKTAGKSITIALVILTWIGAARGAVTTYKPSVHKTTSSPKHTDKPSSRVGTSGLQKPSTLFVASEDFRWGYIDKTGKVVLSGYENACDVSEDLAPVKLGGQYGFVDKTGKVIIAPQFDDASGFSEGLAPVQVGKAFGYIDKTGNAVIKPQYDEVARFSDGLGVIKIDGKYGAIDKTGAVVIQPSYQAMGNASGDLIAINQDGKWGFIDKTEKVVITPQFDWVDIFVDGLAPACSDHKCGFIDKTGKWVVEPSYDQAMPFSEGLATVSVKKTDVVRDKKSGRVVKMTTYMLSGYIDATGKEVIPLSVRGASQFSDGLAACWKDGQFVFIDKTGATALIPIYNTHTGSFHNGLAKTEIGPRSGYIDETGKMVIPQQFPSGQPFSEGLAAVRVYPDGPWGFIDATGHMTIKPQFSNTFGFHKGFATVETMTQWGCGIIDKTGKTVLEPKFDSISWYTDKIVAAKVNDLWGFFDWSGKAVLEPQFDSASFLGDKYAIVKKDGNYGVVDTSGKLVVPTEYDDACWLLSEGLLPISKDGKFGFIDADGKPVIEPQYDAVGGFTPEGLSAVKVGDKWGFIDRANKLVIAPNYDCAVCFSEDRAAVRVGNKWGFIDKAGKLIVKPQFTEANYFSGGLAPVQVGQKWGYIDNSGRMAIPSRFDKAGTFDNNLAEIRLGSRTGYINTTGKIVWLTRDYPSMQKPTAPAPSQALAEVTINSDGVRIVNVKVAGDQVLGQHSDWRAALEKRMQSVSDLLEKNFKIRLAVTSTVPWDTPDFKQDDDPDDYGTRINNILIETMPLGNAEIAIGFTGRASGSNVLGFTHYYFNRIIIYDPYDGDPEKEMQLVITIAHELCHTFGAFHVGDADSIMHATVEHGHLPNTFDQCTARQLDLMRDYDFIRGLDSISQDKIQKAEVIYEDGHVSPDVFSLAKAHSYRASRFLRTDIGAAVEEYRKAIELEGKEPALSVVCGLGEALLKDGQLVPGMETIRRCPSLKTEASDAAWWHSRIASDLNNQISNDRAFVECQQAITPKLPEIYERYVRARVNPDEMLSEYSKAVKAEPEDASYHFKFAEALWQCKRSNEALAEYKQAAELKPDNYYYKSKYEDASLQIAAQSHKSQ